MDYTGTSGKMSEKKKRSKNENLTKDYFISYCISYTKTQNVSSVEDYYYMEFYHMSAL